MKRILFFSHFPTRFGLDGANKILMLTAAAVPNEAFEKMVLLQSHGAVSEYLDEQSVPYTIMTYDCDRFNSLVYSLYDKSDLDGICQRMEEVLASSRLFQFMKSWKPDIVYVNTTMAICGAILGKMAGAKVFWHIHDIATGILGMEDHKNLNGIVARYADKAVVVSKAVREALHDTGKMDHVELVYIGVEDPGFSERAIDGLRSTIRRGMGVPESTPLVAYLGQIAPLKGIDRFIKAAHLILTKEPSAQFIIIGDYRRDKSYTKGLRHLIKRLGREGSIRFTGYSRDLSSILPAIDCLAVPSAYEEPFGAITVEANLYRKPVVAFDRGGIGEGVIHGKNGFLVEKDHIKHMAAAIYTLLRDPDGRRLMGRYGYQRAIHRFDYTTYLSNMTEILHEVSEGRFIAEKIRDGAVVKNSAGSIFYIQGGRRISIPSPEAMEAMGLDDSDIQEVPDTMIESIPQKG